MTAARLFDSARETKPRWTGSTALVVRPPACPECDAPLLTVSADQPALFIHGGHGATRRTTWSCCPACRWSLESVTEEVRPEPDSFVSTNRRRQP